MVIVDVSVIADRAAGPEEPEEPDAGPGLALENEARLVAKAGYELIDPLLPVWLANEGEAEPGVVAFAGLLALPDGLPITIEPGGLMPEEGLAIGPVTLADEVGEYVYTAAVALGEPAAGVMGPEAGELPAELEPAPAPLGDV